MSIFFNYVASLLLLLGLGFGIASCFGPTTQLPPGKRIVLTENTNVREEFLGTKEVVEIPINQLNGDIGRGLQEAYSERGSIPVITTEDNLKPIDPRATRQPIMIVLDGPSMSEIFNADVIDIIFKTIGVSVPGPWQPWIVALGGILGLFNRNYRENMTLAAKKTIPGVQGPNNDGRIPDLKDLREGIVDFTKAIMFLPADKEDGSKVAKTVVLND